MKQVKKEHVVAYVLITLVLIGGSYFAGTKHKSTQARGAFANGQFMNGQGGASARTRIGGGGLVAGEVLSKDATSVTVKMRDGSSRIVLYSGTTQVMKSTSGSIDDVAVGSQVMVQGATNSDGSVTAQSIQIRPQVSAPQAQ
jgi:hypothetical protein